MSVREYIGARYVPLFASPLQWSSENTYEPLTIVQYQGNSYTSRQYVPTGIDILNESYWALTGNYNAQIEAYRAEVREYGGRITDVENDVDTIVETTVPAIQQSIGTIEDDIEALQEADVAFGNSMATANANIATNAESIEYLNAKQLKGKKFVCIGDSYGRGSGTAEMQGWPYWIQQYAQPGYLLNVSNGRAGFVNAGTTGELNGMTFNDQIDYAATHLVGCTAADIDYVIIGGGYNDCSTNQSWSDVRNACLICGANALSTFPNAKVYYFPLIVGTHRLGTEWMNNITHMIRAMGETGCASNTNSLYWLFPNAQLSSAGDGVHPNEFGYQMIATYMIATMNGGNINAQTFGFATSSEGFAFAEGASQVSFKAMCQNGYAFYGGAISRTGSGVLCTLPYYCRPSSTQYQLAFFYQDSTHNGVCRMYVNASGTLEAYIPQTGTIDETLECTYYIPPTTIPLGNVW